MIFRLSRNLTYTLYTRGCHDFTHRDRQIAQLFRELGEYHFRDNLLHQQQILKEIQELENSTPQEEPIPDNIETNP